VGDCFVKSSWDLSPFLFSLPQGKKLFAGKFIFNIYEALNKKIHQPLEKMQQRKLSAERHRKLCRAYLFLVLKGGCQMLWCLYS
jgi:hypothetical protein